MLSVGIGFDVGTVLWARLGSSNGVRVALA